MKALIVNPASLRPIAAHCSVDRASKGILASGETVLERQIRVLAAQGISDFFIALPRQVNAYLGKQNPRIYRGELRITWLTDDTDLPSQLVPHLDDATLVVHSDTVFDAGLIAELLQNRRADLVAYCAQADVDCTSEDAVTSVLPVHLSKSPDRLAAGFVSKLSAEAIRPWVGRVASTVVEGWGDDCREDVACRAAFRALGVASVATTEHFVRMARTSKELKQAGTDVRAFDLRQQSIIAEHRGYARLASKLHERGIRRPLLVCDAGLDESPLAEYLGALAVDFVRFDVLTERASDHRVGDGISTFLSNGCDGILAIGGEAAIETGKCIALFAGQDDGWALADEDYRYSHVPQIALPIGAGGGAESTPFSWLESPEAVRLVAHESMLPDLVFLDSALDVAVPRDRRAAEVLKTLSRCIEAMWALKACDESQQKALSAIDLLMQSLFTYLRDPKPDAVRRVMLAANRAGQSASISGDTAARAMGAELARRFSLPSGLAQIICVQALWHHWSKSVGSGPDLPRDAHFRKVSDRTCAKLGVGRAEDAIGLVDRLVALLDLRVPAVDYQDHLVELVAATDQTCLANSPLGLSAEELHLLYEKVLQPRPALERETATREFSILVRFTEFCRRNELRCYLAGETLRDAIVHGHVTPWNHRLSVAMPREDYLLLRKRADQLPVGMMLQEGPSLKGDGLTPVSIADQSDVDVSNDSSHHLPSVELRVLEAVGGRFLERVVNRALWQSFHIAATPSLSRSNAATEGGMATRVVAGIGRRVRPGSLARAREWVGRRRPPTDEVHYFVDLTAGLSFKRSHYPAKWLRGGRDCSLNGIAFRVPVHATSVLARTYGMGYRSVKSIPLDGRLRGTPLQEQVDRNFGGVVRAGSGVETVTQKPFISIIVPVYNVERYLAECLDSLVVQSYSSYEIICVNDGSTDASQAILEYYQQQYPQLIHVFMKSNGGLSDARNYGIERSQGDYLAFVDSDDIVSPLMLQLMADKAASCDADMVVCRMAEYWAESGQYKEGRMRSVASYGHSVLERPELLVAAQPYAWNKLYRKRLFTDNRIRYPQGQAFEDSATTFNLMLEANRIELVDEALYFYRKDRPDSITNTFDARFYDIFKSFDSIRSYYVARGYDRYFANELNEVMRRTAFARLNTLEGCSDKEGVRAFIDAVYDYMDTNAPDWAQNPYFAIQMRNPVFGKHPKYRAAGNREAMKAYFSALAEASNRSGLSSPARTDRELTQSLQHETLAILLELDRICSEHALTYFLAEGTLLGAVRHAGFIPWDDDIDICMPRDDYERLINFLIDDKTHSLRVFNERTYSRYFLTFTKVLSALASQFETATVEVPIEFRGPAVDVFPLDAGVKRRDLAKESRVRWLRDALLFKAGYMSAATRKKKRACYLASKVYTYRYLQDSIQKLYRSYETGEAAMYLVNYASSYSVTKEKFRSKWFASSKRITFEGQQLPVPSNWDAVLGTTYGAYMELPPTSRRLLRHRPQWLGMAVQAGVDEN